MLIYAPTVFLLVHKEEEPLVNRCRSDAVRDLLCCGRVGASRFFFLCVVTLLVNIFSREILFKGSRTTPPPQMHPRELSRAACSKLALIWGWGPWYNPGFGAWGPLCC